ncbi:hypothetical protein QQP08_006381 [Theobroma cacao]|nr:hypothetical protein QQP08_006381 [Theobroma cacao]
MTSSTYHCSDLQHIVCQPLVEPQRFYPTPRSVQIELTITVQLQFRRHYCLTNQFIDLDGEASLFSQETISTPALLRSMRSLMKSSDKDLASEPGNPTRDVKSCLCMQSYGERMWNT